MKFTSIALIKINEFNHALPSYAIVSTGINFKCVKACEGKKNPLMLKVFMLTTNFGF